MGLGFIILVCAWWEGLSLAWAIAGMAGTGMGAVLGALLEGEKGGPGGT